MKRAWAVCAGAVLLAAAGGAAWFLTLPAGPAEAEGRAWLAAFADKLTSPQVLGARGPAAAALFPDLKPAAEAGCVTEWSLRDASAPIVTSQRLELGRMGPDACDQAQFGMLSTTLRQSDGVAPGILAERFTERFGPPVIHRDAIRGGAITYVWQIADYIFVHMDEPLGRGHDNTFSVLFMRYYAGPTHLPTEAEAGQWMDRTVDLLTGPALARARGPAAAHLVAAEMRPEVPDSHGCPTAFMADLLVRGPIERGETLFLERGDGARCDDARVASLSMMVWRHAPVTAEALVQRIGARLGAPVVSRDFEQDEVGYHWDTPHGMTVDLTEGLSGEMLHWLTLRTSRR